MRFGDGGVIRGQHVHRVADQDLIVEVLRRVEIRHIEHIVSKTLELNGCGTDGLRGHAFAAGANLNRAGGSQVP